MLFLGAVRKIGPKFFENLKFVGKFSNIIGLTEKIYK